MHPTEASKKAATTLEPKAGTSSTLRTPGRNTGRATREARRRRFTSSRATPNIIMMETATTLRSERLFSQALSLLIIIKISNNYVSSIVLRAALVPLWVVNACVFSLSDESKDKVAYSQAKDSCDEDSSVEGHYCKHQHVREENAHEVGK
jgi:hypothetical protein